MTPPPGSMTAADLGDQWPLTVDKINLDCSRGAVYFDAGGTYYTLNGTAKGSPPRLGRTWPPYRSPA